MLKPSLVCGMQISDLIKDRTPCPIVFDDKEIPCDLLLIEHIEVETKLIRDDRVHTRRFSDFRIVFSTSRGSCVLELCNDWDYAKKIFKQYSDQRSSTVKTPQATRDMGNAVFGGNNP